ncbi:polycomb group protein Psc-like [Physella acuta]|uniref:polycomb group protein Psc-like n=1 Tax=Physella acuta TaxID=109671 RepID=UPI0027DE4528|nr:polycomb group protein Psc-like [Physella acuta]
MNGTTRLKIGDINKNLICVLCEGYFIDATTIIECLHSFCRTCIVTYLKTSKTCPVCDTVVHKTRPHQNIRSDKLLQDLVYKLVPGLYKDEMRRRREFYTTHYEAAPKRAGEERGDEMSDRFAYTEEEKISLALHFCPDGASDRVDFRRVFTTKEDLKTRIDRRIKEAVDVRYLQCKAAVTVGHLKKFVRLKYNLPVHYQIDMFYNDEPLRNSLTLCDVAYIFNWRRRAPLSLTFCVFEGPNPKKRKMEEVKQLNTNLTEEPKVKAEKLSSETEMSLSQLTDTLPQLQDKHKGLSSVVPQKKSKAQPVLSKAMPPSKTDDKSKGFSSIMSQKTSKPQPVPKSNEKTNGFPTTTLQKTSKTRPVLVKTQPNLTKMQPDFAKVQTDFAKTQPDFAKTQPDFAKTQPDFAKTQSISKPDEKPNGLSDLAKTQLALAKTQPDLVKTQPDSAKTQPVLAKTHPDLTKSQSISKLDEKPNGLSSIIPQKTSKAQSVLANPQPVLNTDDKLNAVSSIIPQKTSKAGSVTKSDPKSNGLPSTVPQKTPKALSVTKTEEKARGDMTPQRVLSKPSKPKSSVTKPSTTQQAITGPPVCGLSTDGQQAAPEERPAEARPAKHSLPGVIKHHYSDSHQVQSKTNNSGKQLKDTSLVKPVAPLPQAPASTALSSQVPALAAPSPQATAPASADTKDTRPEPSPRLSHPPSQPTSQACSVATATQLVSSSCLEPTRPVPANTKPSRTAKHRADARPPGKSLLGKRQANGPVLIAPAPSKLATTQMMGLSGYLQLETKQLRTQQMISLYPAFHGASTDKSSVQSSKHPFSVASMLKTSSVQAESSTLSRSNKPVSLTLAPVSSSTSSSVSPVLSRPAAQVRVQHKPAPESSQTVSSTSIASPTPAASASPTPAAVPVQQSQTQGSDTAHLTPVTRAPTPEGRSFKPSLSVEHKAETCSQPPHSSTSEPIAVKSPTSPPSSSLSSTSPSSTSSLSTSPSSTSSSPESSNQPSTQSPSPNGSSQLKKQVAQKKKIADIANTLLRNQNCKGSSVRKSSSPSLKTLCQPTLYEGSVMGRHELAIKQTLQNVPPTSGGRSSLAEAEEPLNLVKRDKDVMRLSNGVLRS